MDENEDFWQDDYESGSFKTWIRKKYTGPFYEMTHGEGIWQCKEDLKAWKKRYEYVEVEHHGRSDNVRSGMGGVGDHGGAVAHKAEHAAQQGARAGAQQQRADHQHKERPDKLRAAPNGKKARRRLRRVPSIRDLQHAQRCQ